MTSPSAYPCGSPVGAPARSSLGTSVMNFIVFSAHLHWGVANYTFDHVLHSSEFLHYFL